MKIGIPKEVKDHEYRVGLVPAGVHALVQSGHEVLVERDAGAGSGVADREYEDAGARIAPSAEDTYGAAEMVIKVKEPVAAEYDFLQQGQILFTFLHLAPLPELTDVLLDKQVTGIAYETITDSRGGLPLLTPMSEVAGRMAVLAGTQFLQRPAGGSGVLLSGVPGVSPGVVLILGGGIVGLNSAKMALGLRAQVILLETNLERLRYLDDVFGGSLITQASNHHNLVSALEKADVVIGAVLIPGRSAPKLVTRQMLSLMKKGSVLVDVSVDQGGCFETTRPTTHSEPVYEVDGIVHYSVANMPGAVPRTSTFALTNATLPFALALASKGFERAVRDDKGLLAGVNTYGGAITCQPVAESQGREFRPLADLL